MTIGDRIRRIRKKRRLTQAELAMMSGLSLSAIQGYEQGRYEPKRKPLESIAEVFKISVDELYDMPAQLSTNLAEVGTDCSEFPNNSDAISRQSVIDVLDETRRIAERNIDGAVLMTFERVLDSLVNITNALPAIQPERKECEEREQGKCPWYAG